MLVLSTAHYPARRAFFTGGASALMLVLSTARLNMLRSILFDADFYWLESHCEDVDFFALGHNLFNDRKAPKSNG